MKLKQLFVAIAATSLFSSFSQAMTLEEAFNQAQRTNPTILAAQHRELAQQQKIDQEKAAYLPSLDVYSSWGKEKSRNSTTESRSGEKNKYLTETRSENKIALKQLIFDGFSIPNRVAAAKAEGLAESQNTLNVREAIFINVVEVYLDVLRYHALLKQGQDYVKAQQSIAAKVDDRASTGYSDKADQLQASSRLRLAKAELRQIERDFATAKASFERVVGVEPQGLSMPDTQFGLPETMEMATQTAINENPGLKMAMARKDASEKNYDASQGVHIPVKMNAFSGKREHLRFPKHCLS